jgi:hypothetical protein
MVEGGKLKIDGSQTYGLKWLDSYWRMFYRNYIEISKKN